MVLKEIKPDKVQEGGGKFKGFLSACQRAWEDGFEKPAGMAAFRLYLQW